MYRIIIAILFTVVINLFSCEKENGPGPADNFDTKFPREYLPAYPGSWWVYQTGDTLRTKEDYQLFTYRSECGDITDTKYELVDFKINKN